MTIGEKIKKFRLIRNLSQKQVALRAGMSEPAIRNYELGNRTPSDTQIEKIALALDISPFAIANPNLDTEIGIMHAFFYLEEKYGLIPEMIDGNIYLKFEDFFSTNNRDLQFWYEEYRKLQETAPGEYEQARTHYEEWKCSYPKLKAEEIKQRLQAPSTNNTEN